MFGPRRISTFSASSSLAGAITALSSILNTSGIVISGISPRSMGSVISPVRAAATAVSGEQRYTFASAVPLLPSKFLLKVRRDTPPELGEKPMPIQGPHAHSSTLAPDAIISERAPLSASIPSTCLEPGDMERLTSGETVFPLRIAATLSISKSDELVHEPIQT